MPVKAKSEAKLGGRCLMRSRSSGKPRTTRPSIIEPSVYEKLQISTDMGAGALQELRGRHGYRDRRSNSPFLALCRKTILAFNA